MEDNEGDLDAQRQSNEAHLGDISRRVGENKSMTQPPSAASAIVRTNLATASAFLRIIDHRTLQLRSAWRLVRDRNRQA